MDSFFFWSKEEAKIHQTEQIGASACGATAVINALKVLNVPYEVEEVDSAVKTRLRALEAPLPEYLFSRSVAGATHEDLIKGLQEYGVYARFFHFLPDCDVNLCEWLMKWMKEGTVPIMTLNLQKVTPPGEEIHDAWHHQMVYGVDDKNVFMCNPVVACPSEVVKHQLCSDSVLLIRRNDILERLDPRAELSEINKHQDVRWKNMNVVGQIKKLIREELSLLELPSSNDLQLLKEWLLTSHISIPAAYKSGVTLCVRGQDSQIAEKLKNASELPVS